MHSITLALLLLFSTWADTSQNHVWQEFTSAEGKFSALMPDKPTTSFILTNTPRGVVQTYTVSSAYEGNSYLVSWTEYKQESVEHKATEKTFDMIRDALVADKNGKVLSDSPITLEGHPARAVTYTTEDGMTVMARFYFIKNRFYQVMAERRGPTDSGAAERFLNSFRIVKGSLLVF
ncbi:MAG TPA: hypothetical protein VJQ56_05350 [Blastocatellia bacterium]|nr:hypothetical protein [Blastocatellia bacterium]